MPIEKIFIAILNMSFTGAIVIAALCIIRLVFRGAPKIISYCLWAVAGFRLIFPFSVESTLSLMPIKARPIPQDIAMQPLPRIDSGIEFVNNTLSASLPAAAIGDSVNPLQIWIAVGGFVWILVAGVLLAYGLISYALLKRKLSGAKRIGWPEGNIYEAENIRSPFLLGIFAPRIYLPPGLSSAESGYVILHEKTHVKRKDYLIKFLAYFILCMHWFNPFVWLAFILMSADMEMSCDEKVLKEMGAEMKKEYSLSLLSLAEGGRSLSPSPLAFGEGGIKARIKNILSFKKRSAAITIGAALVALVIAIGFMVNRKEVPKDYVIPDLSVTETESGTKIKAQTFGYSWYDADGSRRTGLRQYGYTWFEGQNNDGIVVDAVATYDGDYDAENTLTIGGDGQNILKLSAESPQTASYMIYLPNGTVYDDGEREMTDSLGSRLFRMEDGGVYMNAPFEAGEYIYEVTLGWEEDGLRVTYGFRVVMTEASVTVPERTGLLDAEDRLYEGFYQIVQKLYETDPALNEGIKYMAVDLAEVPESQRTALELLLENSAQSLGLTFLPMNWDELVDSGYIVTEPIEEAGFKDGILFTFSDVVFEGNILKVQAEKFRGPLGAVIATFTATFEDGVWTVGEPADMVMA